MPWVQSITAVSSACACTHAHTHWATGAGEEPLLIRMCLGDCPCTIYMVVFILMNEESLIGSEWRILNWRMTGSDLYFRRIMAAIWIIDGWGGRGGEHKGRSREAAVELSRWEREWAIALPSHLPLPAFNQAKFSCQMRNSDSTCWGLPQQFPLWIKHLINPLNSPSKADSSNTQDLQRRKRRHEEVKSPVKILQQSASSQHPSIA